MDCASETVHKTSPTVTDDPVMRVISGTWAPPDDLMIDLRVEMNAQRFYATNGCSFIKIQFRSKILCGCDELKWKKLKFHRNRQKAYLSDYQKLQKKSPEFLKKNLQPHWAASADMLMMI